MARKSEPVEAPKKPGRPPFVEVVCSVGNVWTSKGKITRGQAVTLPPAEAEFLIERGQVNGKP